MSSPSSSSSPPSSCSASAAASSVLSSVPLRSITEESAPITLNSVPQENISVIDQEIVEKPSVATPKPISSSATLNVQESSSTANDKTCC